MRIALFLKGVSAELRTIDLLKGEQHREDYRAINPEGLVPAFIEEGEPPLVQSLAILEYIDEKHPDPPLLPRGLRERAYVRALAQVPAMDAHPLIVPRVRNYLANQLGLDEPSAQRMAEALAGGGQSRAGGAAFAQRPRGAVLLRR